MSERRSDPRVHPDWRRRPPVPRARSIRDELHHPEPLNDTAERAAHDLEIYWRQWEAERRQQGYGHAAALLP